MYIILKGRIASKKNMHGDVPILINTPGDGECFGEMSLFEFSEASINDPEAKKRFATCTSVEETHCLRIEHDEARAIFQPEFKKYLKAKKEASVLSVAPDKVDTEEKSFVLDSPRSVKSARSF